MERRYVFAITSDLVFHIVKIMSSAIEISREEFPMKLEVKEGNERLIARKSKIGQVVGFAPMVLLFVAYLIAPMCVIGMTSMTSAFSTMSSMSM